MSKTPKKSEELSKRERQIMDALYRLGKASALEIRESIPNPPTYTAVRTLLTILQEKGHVTYQRDGARYIYEPVVPRDEMALSVVDGVLQTFFEGSVERIVATLLERKDTKLTDEELDRLAELIEQAKREGR